MSQLNSEREERGEGQIPPPSGSQGLDNVYPKLGVYFTESTDSNADPIWKHPHRHSQKHCVLGVPVTRQADT